MKSIPEIAVCMLVIATLDADLLIRRKGNERIDHRKGEHTFEPHDCMTDADHLNILIINGSFSRWKGGWTLAMKDRLEIVRFDTLKQTSDKSPAPEDTRAERTKA